MECFEGGALLPLDPRDPLDDAVLGLRLVVKEDGPLQPAVVIHNSKPVAVRVECGGQGTYKVYMHFVK
jgi:hypothetical protein